MRPLIAAALTAATERGGADRPVLLVTSTYREAEELTGRPGVPAAAGRGRLLPGLGDAAARAAQPALGHRRPPPRGAPPAGRQRRAAAAAGHRGPGPQRAAAAGQGARRPEAGPAGGRRGHRPRRARDRPGRGGVRPGRPGRTARRVRRPRRASSTSSRRPRSTRSGSTSSATPSRRSATSRSPTSAPEPDTLTEVIASPCRELLLTDDVRRRAFALSQQHPELIEMLDKIAQGHAVDGMEALSPALVDGMELLVDAAAARHPRPGLRSGAGPRSGDRPGQDQRGVPARVLGRRGRRRSGADRPRRLVLPAAGRRTRRRARPRVWPGGRCRRSAPARRQPDDARAAADPHRGRRDHRPQYARSARSASSRGSSPGHAGETYRGDTESAINDIAKRIRDGWRVVLMAEGHGLSDRLRRGAHRARPAGPARGGPAPSRPSAGIGTVVTGDLSHGFVADAIKLAVFTAGRPVRAAGRRQGDPQDAGPAEEPDRPAGADPRRPGGAQPARRRPLRGDGAAHASPARPGSTW